MLGWTTKDQSYEVKCQVKCADVVIGRDGQKETTAAVWFGRPVHVRTTKTVALLVNASSS